jgi:hypothetical protein
MSRTSEPAISSARGSSPHIATVTGAGVAELGRPPRLCLRRDGLSAYDAATGHRLWHNAQASAGRPIRAGGLLYLPGMVLSPVTGVRLPVRGYGTIQHHVIVTGGRVYAVDGDTIRTYAPGAAATVRSRSVRRRRCASRRP